jgi:sulfate/thiosulfate transport system substrate-binding protein
MKRKQKVWGRARTRSAAAAAATLVGAVALAACGGSEGGGGEATAVGGASGQVALVAYSTPQEVYESSIQPAFQAGEAGSGISFRNSFGSSGDQSRAVEAGQPADLVHLSLEPDMTRLVDAGLVGDDWRSGEHKGILQDSVVSLLVREGNPEEITGWDDLVRDDVEVLTPNPFTSGGARWNIMAIYGSQLEQGKSEKEALDFVRDVLENTSVQDKSAADALATFLSGKGDVLISYENEAFRARESGEEVEYTVPDETLLIETPVAVTGNAENPEGAEAFLEYLYGPEGQQGFADAGYRPVDAKVLEENRDKFPDPPGLFTIEDLGGWEKVSTDFFDPDDGSIAEINRELGQSTG